MSTTRPKVPAKIKERLYPEVLRLYARKDFHEVTIREIAGATGLSSGTLYKYYPSKEVMLFSIVDEKISELADLMRLHIAGLTDSRAIFRKIHWVTLDFFDKDNDLAIAAFITAPLKNFMNSPAYRREHELDLILEVAEAAKNAGHVTTRLSNRDFADLYFMMVHRQIHNWYFHGRKWRLTDCMEKYSDHFRRIVSPDT